MNSFNKINDFVIRFANVNGTGSASAVALFTKAVFRMGASNVRYCLRDLVKLY